VPTGPIYARPRRTRIALSDRYAPAPRPGFATATAVIAVVDLHGVSQMIVTAEPARGSAVPTAAPVIVVQLN